MAGLEATNKSWGQSIKAFMHPRVITMLFLGFSAGIPILLIFSSLSLWLREAGVERSTVTFFSWAALGYSFKFVWAPLVDKLPVPFLTARFGRRRGWMLASQISIIVAIIWMAQTDPVQPGGLTMMALAALLLGFSSATQDVVIDAYRIESADTDLQALLSSTYVAGYRIAMILAGAGAIFLAEYFGSTEKVYSYSAWQMSYMIMALAMIVGILTTLLIPEPATQRDDVSAYSSNDYLRLLLLFVLAVLGFIATFYFSAEGAKAVKSSLTEFFSNRHLAGFMVQTARLIAALVVARAIALVVTNIGMVNKEMVATTYIDPVKDFFKRYGASLAWLLLALIGLYRISDIVLGVISNVFYQDMGFTKTQIALASKSFGLVMTIAGAFVGGLLSLRFGVVKILFLGALLSALTNLLFMVLAGAGNNLSMLYLVISVDNLSAGLATAAFIAFMAGLVNMSFTATQYAIFSSLMTLFPKIFGGYSGTLVDEFGYSSFFLMTALMGVPVLILIVAARKRLEKLQQ